MSPKYRADHVGSLLRPAEVLEAHVAQLPEAEVRAIEDRCILRALDLQRQVGLDVLSDGEYRRSSWAGDFADAVDGYVPGEEPVKMAWRSPQGDPRDTPRQYRVVGERLRQKHRLTAHESAFLKQHAGGLPYKVTLPAPSYVTTRGWKPGVTDQVYASRKELLEEVTRIVKAEVEALAAEGVPYIQLDNPHYPDYIPEDRREQLRAIGVDPDQALADDVAADTQAVSGIDRQTVTVATHVCRGNSRSAWHTQGGYEPIAERVFGSLGVDRYLLEYDSERAGGFEPLRYMPQGGSKQVVLGLITTKLGELETRDVLLRRIEEASRYVPIDNLALSPQCGFASVAQGNLLSWDDQQRKLELVVETARHVWPRS
jgi:5-methyltetrahydropteroyltriglutamate--homocysteine methyltransferase